MTSEKFCLKWNDFQHNIISSYQELRKELDFSDVTLVCEEDHQVEAHKIILTACSPFFSTVLKRNKHPHPMLYMRGIKAKDLVAIVDFIYHGEANIYQEDLDGFLALAEELQLKGLVGSQKESSDTLETPEEKPPGLGKKYIPEKESSLGHYEDEEDKTLFDEENPYPNTVVPVGYGKVFMDSNTEDLKTKIDSLAERIHDGEFKWKCTVCGKTTKKKVDIGRHIETHLEGVSHTCNQCGKISRSSKALSMHVHLYHKK